MSQKALKKQGYIQRFREEWLTDPELITWLAEVPMKNGGSGAECKFCRVYVKTKISDIKRHGRSKMHINNSQGKQILSPAHQAKATKTHRGQLLNISRPAERSDVDMTEENGLNYSVHQVQPCEFVVLKSDAHSGESDKISTLNTSAVSKDFEFGDLLRFDVNYSNIPYSYLEEKYFEFHKFIDENKFKYKCKLCSPIRFVKVTRKSLFTLKNHIRTRHGDYFDEFLECCKSNSKMGRPRGISNPYPYLEKYYMFKKKLSAKNKVIFECRLCPLINTFKDVRTISCTRKNPSSLEKHIRNHHSSYSDEFTNCVKTYARSVKQKKFSKQSGQSVTPSDKDKVSEWCNKSNSTEHQQSTGTKIKLPKTRCKKLELQISDDEALFDDDVADPDFEPKSPGSPDTIDVAEPNFEPQSPGSPDSMDEFHARRNGQTSPDLINKLATKKFFVRPPIFPPYPDQELSQFVPLFDNVLVQIDETFTPILMKDGVLIPPTYKAKVIAVGRGIRSESGEMIPLEVSVGDGVIIPESGAAVIELDRKEYLLYKPSLRARV